MDLAILTLNQQETHPYFTKRNWKFGVNDGRFYGNFIDFEEEAYENASYLTFGNVYTEKPESFVSTVQMVINATTEFLKENRHVKKVVIKAAFGSFSLKRDEIEDFPSNFKEFVLNNVSLG